MTILLISGSTRAASTNTAVLRTLLHRAPRRARLYEGLADLPAFNPDHDPGDPHGPDRDLLPAPVAGLRAALAASSAVVFCTPEYAGALPGALKNLLDWTVGGAEMPGLAVGWINVASVAAPTGGAAAHAELRTVLGYVGAHVVDAACRRVPLARGDITADGLVADPRLDAAMSAVLDALP